MEGDWTPTKTNLFYSLPKEVGVSSSFKIKDFLNYVSGKEGAGRLVRGLDDAVKKVRNREEWRLEYMTLQMRDQEMMKKGREEGRNLQLWKMIQKKIVKGKSLEQIADELEEREEDILSLYEQVKAELFETT